MARWTRLLLVSLLAVQLWSAVVAEEKGEEQKPEGTEKAEEKVVDGFSESDRTKMAEGSEKHEFQAEVNRLMDIIINSLYTDKQVFLRELISNAADALEKARFHSVQDDTYLGDTKDLEVKLEHDPDAKTISIVDTGIGMSKADLILARVSVTSKCNDDPVQHVWESSADASFTVVDDPRGSTLGRGSRVTLHLKVLFQTALIESGYEIADPSALVNRFYRLMSKELGVDPDAPLKEAEVPKEEEAEEDEKEEEGDEAEDKEEAEEKEEAGAKGEEL